MLPKEEPLPKGQEPPQHSFHTSSTVSYQPSNPTGPCLGPITNLESQVDREWWKKIFNAFYLKTDGDVVEDPEITAQEVAIFVRCLQLKPEDRILDLCCGQGRHSLTLAGLGFHSLFGLDQSAFLIDEAQSRAFSLGFKIDFKQGDARSLPFPDQFFEAVLIPGNSFGYFEDSKDDHQVLAEVKRVLKPGGRLLLDLTDGDYIKEHYERRSWEWVDQQTFVCRERELSKDGDRLISREVITDATKGVLVDQFYAERLYSKATIFELLECAGLTDCHLQQAFEAESKRGMDYGMMSRRLLITSQKKATTKNLNGQGLKLQLAPSRKQRVAVLLGDPRLSDIIKPDAQFDADDAYTVQRLKEALQTLEQYEFSYLDNHASLIKDLENLKADFLLNLCDEGFRNNPFHELHIPSILEMLDLPYSGGNPQCLANCYDKSLVRSVADQIGLKVPREIYVPSEMEQPRDLKIGFPVIVKPNYGDSSFCITKNSVCHNELELAKAWRIIRKQLKGAPVLIEEFLPGKDVSVGLIGNPGSFVALPIIAEDYSKLPAHLPKLCGYEAKWDPTSPYSCIKSIPAGLDKAVENELVLGCQKLFTRLGCQDYARFDWRLDAAGVPRLLEVNPNPGWCWDGHLARMAELMHYDYSQMLNLILQKAAERLFPAKKQLSVNTTVHTTNYAPQNMRVSAPS